MKRAKQIEILNKIATTNNKTWEAIVLYNNKEDRKLYRKWLKRAQLDGFDDMDFLIKMEIKAEKNGFTKNRKEW